ncbi:acyltransferase family protein [Rhodobiaceae bacterium]|jgi:peptidoglycan/LPS O-acetylase OafA/YrhL|nr:acyltransferase family protein [Rhodobiaceae bacterium]
MVKNGGGWVAPSLDALNQGHDNNFNLIRFLAAISVALSHSYLTVSGDPSARPLIAETGFTLGYHAVNVFFVISGFLVTQSWMRSSSIISFATARGLRIYPGIIISTLFVTLVLGTAMTALPATEYLTSPETYLYLTITASLVEPSGSLPGLFLATPDPITVNGSLWTLRYEVICYVTLAVFGIVGILNRPRVFAVIAIPVGIGLLVLSLFPFAHDNTMVFGHFVRFGLCFGLGVVAYQYRAHIPVHWIGVLALIAITSLAFDQAIYPFLLYVTTAYATFWVAYVPKGKIRLFNKSGDYSYGIYIYAYPIQQTLISLAPDITPIQMFGAAVAASLPLAIASWHLVEHPTLRWKRPLADFFIKKAGLADS